MTIDISSEGTKNLGLSDKEYEQLGDFLGDVISKIPGRVDDQILPYMLKPGMGIYQNGYWTTIQTIVKSEDSRHFHGTGIPFMWQCNSSDVVITRVPGKPMNANSASIHAYEVLSALATAGYKLSKNGKQ